MTAPRTSADTNDLSSPFQFLGTGVSLQILATFLEVSQNGRMGGRSEERDRKVRQHLQKLETALARNLRKVGSTPFQLTSEGVELAGITRRFFVELDEFYRRCRNRASTLTIGTGDSLANWVLLPVLPQVLNKQKAVNCSVVAGGTEKLVTWLRDSTIDLALLREQAKIDPKWRSELIGDYHYCVVCPKRLAKQAEIVEKIPANLPFALSRNWELDFAQMALEAGANPELCVTCETFTHVASLVRTGFYAGILPASTVSSFSSELFERFDIPALQGTAHKIILVWNPDAAGIKPLLATFAAALLEPLRAELQSKERSPIRA